MTTLFETTYEPEPQATTPSWIAASRREKGEFSTGLSFGASQVDELEPSPIAQDDIVDPIARAREEGEAEGYAKARTEFEAKLADIDSSFAVIEDAFAQRIGQLLDETVVSLCASTLTPLTLDKELLQRRCENAAALVQKELSEAVLILHPDQAQLIEGLLDPSITIQSDPEAEPGAIRLVSPDTQVLDGPAQWRDALHRAIEQC